MNKYHLSRNFLSGALSFFTLFMVAYAVSSSFFFVAKGAGAQSCAGGASTCGIQVCPAGTQNIVDPVCTGRNCCVPNNLITNGCVGQCLISGCGGYANGFGTCTGPDVGKSCCSTQPAPTPSPTAFVCNASVFSGGLVLCGKGDSPDDCTFEAFICLLRRIMNFLLFVLAVPIAAISFAWAGWLYLSAAGNESKIKQAHEIFGTVLLGLCIALAAWLIVHAIVKGLGVGEQYNFLGG